MTGPPFRDADMRVLHIMTVPISLNFLRGQVGYMLERGVEIHALTSPGPELAEFGRAEGVEVTAVEMTRRITPLRDLRAVIAILRAIRRIRPDIVHAHTPKAGLIGMIAASLAGTRVRIYHMRGGPLAGATGLKRLLLWSAERLTCRLAHRVYCVSHSLRNFTIRSRLCRPERAMVLAGGSGNGVDAQQRFNPAQSGVEARVLTRRRLGIPTDAVVIGFVGRIVRDKGIIELTAAWQQLREQTPSARLLLIGPFEPEDPVPPDVLLALREDPRVHLPGVDWNTPPLYAAMDVVVLPSYREGLPNVPLEAAAMELPVVATAVPGCIDATVDGITGKLVPVRDANALAAALAAYLADPQLRRAHGVAARQRVQLEFRQEVIWAALHNEYLHLLTRHTRPFWAPTPFEDASDGKVSYGCQARSEAPNSS